ncbi:hypothetical protein [Paenibacillus senegalensis]|uniref:hypothetical protein n=1 Tax=Paenibacillus senegalensis TaxID=1465766 RepID=UPI0002893743|nr:hypothetical protein [Paenibacillus senegalensis]
MAVTTLNYENAFAVIESYTNLPMNSPFVIGFEIICDKGSIHYHAEYGNNTVEEYAVQYSNGHTEAIKPHGEGEYEQVLRHIKHCLDHSQRSDLLDISSAIHALKITDAVLKSLESQQSIPVQK